MGPKANPKRKTETTKEASSTLSELNSSMSSGIPGANMEEARGLNGISKRWRVTRRWDIRKESDGRDDGDDGIFAPVGPVCWLLRIIGAIPIYDIRVRGFCLLVLKRSAIVGLLNVSLLWVGFGVGRGLRMIIISCGGRALIVWLEVCIVVLPSCIFLMAVFEIVTKLQAENGLSRALSDPWHQTKVPKNQ